MHTTATARETLEFLWNNYLILAEQVDLDTMLPETLSALVKDKARERPFRIRAWLVRQGFFVTEWALWEYYARNLCLNLPNKKRKKRNESTVNWVARSLNANNMKFVDQDWFSSANSLRNLIAHFGARTDCSRSNQLLMRSRTAFPDIETWKDGYVAITHDHLAELQLNIEDFINCTALPINSTQ